MDTSTEHAQERDWSLLGDLGLASAGLLGLVVVMGFVFAPPSPAAAGGERTRAIGRSESVSNNVRRRADSVLVWDALVRGNTVFEDDRVFVGADSTAVIALDDGSRLDIGENSLVVVRRAGTEGALATTTVELLRGNVSGQAGAQGLAVRARGNELALKQAGRARLRLRADQGAQLEVEDGEAVLKTDGAEDVALKAGQRQEIGEGGERGALSTLGITLESPAAGARVYFANTRPKLSFRWSACEGEGPYLLELSDGPDFGSLVTSVRTPQTVASHAGVAPGVYYWRVRRPGSAAGCDSAERRVSVVEDRAPVLMQPRSGETVYRPAGADLAIVWGEVPGAGAYDVELLRGRSPLAKERATRSTLLYRAPLEEDYYCLRLRIADETRSDTPWSSSTCFRLITKPLPRAPKLFDPHIEQLEARDDDGEVDKGAWLWRLFGGVAHAAEPARRATVLRWEAIPGITSYIIEIAEDRAFSKMVVRKRIDHNYFKWQVLAHRDYFWRVKSVDAEGREGEFSEVRMIGAAVGGSKPLAPRDGALFDYGDEPPRVVLKWEGSEHVVRYIVEVAGDAGFTRGLKRHDSGQPSFTLRPAGVGRFHWRVTGVDANGEKTAKSKSRSFTVAVSPPTPQKPVKGMKVAWADDGLRLRLQWAGRPVKGYEVQWSRSRKMQRQTKTLSSDKPALSIKPPAIGRYFWRVRTTEPSSDWSAVESFAVTPAPPALVAPEGGHVDRYRGQSASITLSWTPVAQAAAYLVDLTGEGQEPVRRRVDGATEALFEQLGEGRYTWTVRAVHKSNLDSAPAEPRGFALIPYGPPRAPVLTAPAKGEEIQVEEARLVAFEWEEVREAASYELEFARDSEFRVLEGGQAATSTSTHIEFPKSIRLFWRARAVDEAGQAGEWSPPRAFAYEVKARPGDVGVSGGGDPVVEEPRRMSLHVGPRLAFFYNLGQVISPRGALELGYRLPVLDQHIGLALSAGYYTSSTSVSNPEGSVTAESRLHGVPLDLVAFYEFFTDWVDLYVGGGPTLDISYSTVTIPGHPVLGFTDVGFGAVAVAGAERMLGPGAVFADLRYAFTTQGEGVVETNPGGLNIGLGYRFRLW